MPLPLETPVVTPASREPPAFRAVRSNIGFPARNRLPAIRPYLGVRTILDLAISLYGIATLLAVLLNGIAISGFLRITSAAKPLLTLAILIPIRLALGGASPLSAPMLRLSGEVRRFWRLRVPEAIRDVLLIGFLSRTAELFVGIVANALIPPVLPRPFAVPGPWPKIGEALAVWDSGWYWDIAMRGYYYSPDHQSSIAFFPLYPMLTRTIAALFGGSAEAAFWSALGLSWVAFGAALVMLHRLTALVTGDARSARRTVMLIAVFPFSFYFTRIYTESLFLLLTVTVFDAALRRQWIVAGAVGALAALTRPNGILIAVPLALMAWIDVRRSGGARPVVAVMFVPVAWAGYCLYVYSLAGDPLAWLGAQQHWNYALDRLPHRHLLRTFSAIEQHGLYAELFRSGNAPIELLYSITALIFIGAVPFIWKRFGAPAGCYVLLSLLIPLSGSKLEGIGRYASVLFPAFMLAGAAWSRRVFEVALVVSCLLLALCAVLFVGWHPLQ